MINQVIKVHFSNYNRNGLFCFSVCYLPSGVPLEAGPKALIILDGPSLETEKKNVNQTPCPKGFLVEVYYVCI